MHARVLLWAVLLACSPRPYLVSADEKDAAQVQIDVTKNVTCSRPSQSGDWVSMHYRGRLTSGRQFDESYKRGVPFTFYLGAGRVIKGWDQGLLSMCPGEMRTLTIPSELGYGHRGAPPDIPPDATLIFDTELMSIEGVEQEFVSTILAAEPTAVAPSSTSELGQPGEENAFTIATAPPTPPEDFDTAPSKTPPASTLAEDAGKGSESGPHDDSQSGECRLLGPFALIVQAALGGVAVLSLVFKRWRESPRRPWKVWFFDVSKQVLGSVLLHVLNVFMSMFGAGDMADELTVAGAAAAVATAKGEVYTDEQGRMPNPCSYYLLNLGIDTTIGIPVLYVLLIVLHKVFLYTPLAKPPESIKSGHYGATAAGPQYTWWLKQSLIYFIGLVGMKLFVWFLFAALPWLPWVGDWALRWTEGNEALQIAFVMFIFPVLMNAIQYYIIDSFIKESATSQGYSRVGGDEDDNSSYHDRSIGGGSDDSNTEVDDEQARPKMGTTQPHLKDVEAPSTGPGSDNDAEGSGGKRTPPSDGKSPVKTD